MPCAVRFGLSGLEPDGPDPSASPGQESPVHESLVKESLVKESLVKESLAHEIRHMRSWRMRLAHERRPVSSIGSSIGKTAAALTAASALGLLSLLLRSP